MPSITSAVARRSALELLVDVLLAREANVQSVVLHEAVRVEVEVVGPDVAGRGTERLAGSRLLVAPLPNKAPSSARVGDLYLPVARW
jgi:hypothetical protein